MLFRSVSQSRMFPSHECLPVTNVSQSRMFPSHDIPPRTQRYIQIEGHLVKIEHQENSRKTWHLGELLAPKRVFFEKIQKKRWYIITIPIPAETLVVLSYNQSQSHLYTISFMQRYQLCYICHSWKSLTSNTDN